MLTTRGWLTTIASLFVAIFSYGFIRAWGNYFTEILNHVNSSRETGEFYQKQDIQATSSFILAGVSIGATTCGLILPKIGNKLATILSGIVITAGYLLFSFSVKHSEGLLFKIYPISFVLIGMPMGIMHTACQNSIKEAVPKEHRGFAMTLFSAGNTVGPFIFPDLFTFFYETFGIVRALAFTGCLFVLICVVGTQLKNTTSEKPKFFDTELLGQKQYYIYVIHAAFGMAAYFGTFTFLPNYCESVLENNFDMGARNLTSFQIKSEITSQRNSIQKVLTGVEGLGRILGMFIADRFQKESILQVVYLGLIIAWSIFAILPSVTTIIPEVYFLYSGSSLAGLCTGCFTGILFALLVDVVPNEKHAVGAAMNQLVLGIANFGSIFVMSRGMLWSLKFPYYLSIGYYVLAFVLLRLVRKYNDERLKGQESAEMESLNH